MAKKVLTILYLQKFLFTLKLEENCIRLYKRMILLKAVRESIV